jgi:hypothetical protein
MDDRMHKGVFFLLVLLLLLWTPGTVRAELQVQADRQQLALDETLTLTITKNGRGSIDDAALQPLANDFRILGRSQGSSMEIINGSISSSSTVTVELAPKRTGILMVPALVSGNESSQPLTIRVDAQAAPRSRSGGEAAMFLETEVDTHSLLVQEQLLYTLRIYWAEEARIGTPEPPQLRDALVEKVGEANYTKVVGGRTYRVFESKFAIFPQKSGVLEIPAPQVQAVVAGRQRPDPFAGFFGQTGEEVRLRGNPERVTVREQAKEYPAGAAWLPTDKLTVGADWSSDPARLKVGEPVTLTIALAAPGLLGAQLPAVALPEIEGAKLYQDKAQVENLHKDGGITGLRKESIALVPTRPGRLTVPEVRIPWWDKGRRQVAYAVRPSRTLEVTGSPVAPGPLGGAASGPSTLPSPVPVAPGAELSPPAGAANISWPWLLVGGGVGVLVLGGWLFTLYLLIQARRQLAVRTAAQGQAEAAQGGREREGFAALVQACHDNDPLRARAALLAWVKSRHPGASVTGAELEKLFPGGGLAEELAAIDRALYGQGTSQWQGGGLLAKVKRFRKGGGEGSGEEPVLPPLYR